MGLFDIFSNKDAIEAANIQQQGAQQAYGQLSDLFGQGRGALTSNYTSALQPFLTNLATGQQGTTAYGNALGLNGPAGNAAATQAFWNNPGIQAQLGIGTENVLRNAAATGQLDSGKTNVDLQNLGQGVAAQGWNNYLSQLSPFLNLNQSSAAGLGNIYTGLGQGLNQSFQGQGNAAYGAITSGANAQANAALADQAASGNLWNAIGGIGKFLAGSGGSGGGIGSALSGLGSGIGSAASGIGSGIGDVLGSLAIFSDERLKEDIEPVGKLNDGQNIYRYRYIGDPTPRIGLMAQEVERRNPDAVTEIGGFKAVDYGKATEYSSMLSKFLEAA